MGEKIPVSTGVKLKWNHYSHLLMEVFSSSNQKLQIRLKEMAVISWQRFQLLHQQMKDNTLYVSSFLFITQLVVYNTFKVSLNKVLYFNCIESIFQYIFFYDISLYWKYCMFLIYIIAQLYFKLFNYIQCNFTYVM